MTEQERTEAAFVRGFKAGWDARGKEMPTAPIGIPSMWPLTQPSTGCPICGVGKNGQAWGYVCNHPSCPTRITCVTTRSNA